MSSIYTAFRKLVAREPANVTVVVWNLNDIFVKAGKRKKGMKISPSFSYTDEERADRHCEAFATLSAKAVLFAQLVTQNSTSCIFIIGGASAMWGVNPEFDRISNEISKNVIAAGVPVISGVPIYRRLSEEGGKYDGISK